MQTIEIGDTLSIPVEVAKCPYCDAELQAQITGVSTDDFEAWVADEIMLDCQSEPDMDSEEWDEWINVHSYMPYVYMLPIQEKVTEWLNNNYIVRHEDER